MGAPARFLVVLLLALAASFSAPPAWARTKIDVAPGFGDRYRAGRWVPVAVTVQSDAPRSAVLELRVPNASSSTMTIRQRIGIGTAPQTYLLYAPLAMQTDPLRVNVFDAATRKPLADWPPDDGNFNVRLGLSSEPMGFVLLTAGRSPALSGYRRSPPGGNRGGGQTGTTLVHHLRAGQVPDTPIGFDAADVLLLNDIDWSALRGDQQRAIIAWVRAGGTLLVWPGLDGVPADAPLAQTFPAVLGEAQNAQIDEKTLKAAGLPPRFGTLTGRALTPAAGTRTFTLFGRTEANTYFKDAGPKIVAGRVGLGQVALLPVDAGVLQFNGTNQQAQFWDRLFDQLVPAQGNNPNAYYYAPDVQAAALGLDRIGDIPNTGVFGFSYVVVIVGAMMLLVGPVDYFVLRKIGRQPWTWGTTLGWIGLVTVAALYAGHVLRSGDLHFRTLRLIEQAPDGVATESALALVYAPRSSTYGIRSGDGWWWQPVPSGHRFNSQTVALPLQTYQSGEGNQPETMWIQVWNWRFLQGKRVAATPPLMKVTFRRTGDRIKGEITNLGQTALRHAEVDVKGAFGTIEIEIPPGETRPFDFTLSAPTTLAAHQTNVYYPPKSGVRLRSQLGSLFELDQPQANAVWAALERGGAAFYAEVDALPTDITIDQPGAITQHKAYVRAIVEPGEASK